MRANQTKRIDSVETQLVPFSTLLHPSVLRSLKDKVIQDGGKVYEHVNNALRKYTRLKETK